MESIDVTFIDDLEYASAQGKFKDRYGRVEIIGEGGYSQVWKAIDFQTGSYCAVKDYSNNPFDLKQSNHIMDVYRFFQNIRHPNLLPTLDCFIENGIPYVVCPYHPIGSIESFQGKITEQELLHLCKDIASGLVYMHSTNHLHMDIKPSNILRSETGDYILSDFGISIELKDIIRQYDQGRTKDTEAYMAPERFKINGEITPASDIWSLGVVLYEMATGTKPFGFDGGKEQISSGKDLTSINIGNQFSSQINNLVRACLNPEPQKRPTAIEIVNFVGILPKISFPDEVSFYATELGFCNRYSKQVILRLMDYQIIQRSSSSLYMIKDFKGNVLVEDKYDSIESFVETCLPGPGPHSRCESFFIGAFFRQGGNVGFFRIRDDGTIEEYMKYSREEYHRRCQFT